MAAPGLIGTRQRAFPRRGSVPGPSDSSGTRASRLVTSQVRPIQKARQNVKTERSRNMSIKSPVRQFRHRDAASGACLNSFYLGIDGVRRVFCNTRTLSRAVSEPIESTRVPKQMATSYRETQRKKIRCRGACC